MVTEPIRLFVGTDPRMATAECALERSVRQNSSCPIDITWMRSGDPGWHDWDIGRQPGNPYPNGRGWATDFTCFRFAIPELAGFRGRAIYLDVDMLVLGDLAELAGHPIDRGFAACPRGRTDVLVYDCEAAQGVFPEIAEMKLSGWTIHRYLGLLRPHLATDVSPHWDCLDGRGLCDETRLIHYTNMRTQPWRPWPERFDYDAVPHPCPRAVDIFWSYAREGGNP